MKRFCLLVNFLFILFLTNSQAQIVITPVVENAVCGQPNGNIFLELDGGVAPYSFSWSGGETTQDLTDVPPDTYSVTVTDNAGNTAEITAEIEDTQITININGVVDPNIGCAPTFTGAISLLVSPAENYNYAWSNGEETETVADLAPDDYSVTVSLGTSCVQETFFTVPNQALVPVLSLFETTPAFCGNPTGSITVEVEKGNDPFEFHWSNDSFFQNLGNVVAGTYTLTITAQVGCTATISATVQNEIFDFDIADVVKNSTSCLAPDGEITLTLSPAEADLPESLHYTFLWSNGDTTNHLQNLPAGIYTVTVNPGGTGCEQTVLFEVENDSQLPEFITVPAPATCGFVNGNVNLTLFNNNNPPYTFLWSNAAVTEDLSKVAAGNYNVTVTNNLGCSDTMNVVLPNLNLPINFTTAVKPDTSCVNATGSIDLTASANSNYTYVWSTGAMTQDLSNLNFGTYTVTISAGGTCVTTKAIPVSNLVNLPIVNETITAAACNMTDGSINLAVGPPALAPFVFNWSTAATTQNISNLAAGNYTVTISAANGCSRVATYQVPSANPNLKIFSNNITPTANCAPPDGAIDLSVDPAAAYTFLWSNGQTSEDITDLLPGNYTVTVFPPGPATCPANATFVVADNRDLPIVETILNPSKCGLGNGIIKLAVSAGTPDYTFEWTTGDTKQDQHGLKPGFYDVSVTDKNGCTVVVDSIEIEETSIDITIKSTIQPNTTCDPSNGAVLLDITSSDPSFSNFTFIWSNTATTEDLMNLSGGNFTVTVTAIGNCFQFADFTVPSTAATPDVTFQKIEARCGQATGSINITVTGASPFTYIWSNGEITQDITNLIPGDYTVTVTDKNGCSATKTIPIEDKPVIISITGTAIPNTACGSFNGNIDITASPVTPNYVFKWSNGATAQDLTGIPGGTYTVTVCLGTTCSEVKTFTVGETQTTPVLSGLAMPDTCGGSVGRINLTVSGAGNFTFNWSNMATSEDLTNLVPGNYTVTVSSATGCTATQTFTVGTSTSFSLTGTPADNTNCTNENGSINLVLNPPVPTSGNYIFNWSNAVTTEDLSNLPPGDYSVTVTDAANCSSTATFSVGNDTALPQISGTAIDVKCFGDATGAISVTVSGGTTPYIYVWLPNVPTPSDPKNLLPGNYNLTLTDAAGCTSTANFSVAQPAAALNLICEKIADATSPGATDGSARLTLAGGTVPYSVDLQPGAPQTNVPAGILNLNNLTDGKYDVTVTDANGCTTICDFEILSFSCATAVGSMDILPKNLCGTGCISAVYNTTGQNLEADDALQFILHTGNGANILGEISRNATPDFCFDASKMTFGTPYFISAVVGNALPNGDVDLTDACTGVAVGTQITFFEIPKATIAAPTDLDCLKKTATLVGSSSIAGSSFLWSASGGGQISGANNLATATASAAGNFQLIVISNGCADTATVAVLDKSVIISAAISANPAAATLDCNLRNIDLTGSAGGGIFDFSWFLNGNQVGGTANFTANQAGNFQLVATDPANSCADTTEIEILDIAQFPPISISQNNDLTCRDTSAILTGNSNLPGIIFNWVNIVGTDTTVLAAGQNLTVNQPGQYFLTGLNPANGCKNIISQNVLTDLQPPTADAGQPFLLDCLSATKNLDGSGSTGQGNLDFSWTTADGNLVAGNTSATPEISIAGIYELVVTDSKNGCTNADEVEITSTAPSLDPQVVQPKCAGDLGSLNFSKISGGTPPFLYSVDGGATFTNQINYPNLAASTIQVVVQDALGCEDSTTVFITAPNPLTLVLPGDTTTFAGISVQIFANSSVAASNLAQIIWTPSDSLSCSDCLDPFAEPKRTTLYKLEIVDSSGCRASDEIIVKVERGKVFVPNIFYPKSEIGNELFTVYGDIRSVRRVLTFQIFDRWGNKIFENNDFLPNDTAAGWSGKVKGKGEMTPAVFIWYAKILYSDGLEEVLKGDVLVKR